MVPQTWEIQQRLTCIYWPALFGYAFLCSVWRRMMRVIRDLAIGFSAACLLPGSASFSAEPIPVEAFAALPEFDGLMLSPDGRYLAVRAYQGDYYKLVIYDLDNIKTKKPMIVGTDAWSATDLKWANNDRVLVTVLHATRRNFLDLYVNQLTAFDADGGNPLVFTSSKTKAGSRREWLLGDDIISILPDDPEHVLISWNPDNFKEPRLYKMNVYTSKLTLVQRGKRGVQSWLVDQEGQPRVGGGIEGQVFKAFYRPVGKKNWQQLFQKNLRERTAFYAVLIDPADPDIAYVMSDFKADTIGLYKYRLSTASFIEEVFRHPDVDIAGPVFDRNRTELHGVVFVSGDFEVHWLSRIEPEILRKIQDRLPEFGLSIASKSQDYKRLVVRASAADRPDRYYLYEPDKDKLQFFAHTFPLLDGKPLSSVQTMSYKARDGLEIEAFVSLPAGISYPPADPLPTVIMPHGGPAARDFAAFDPMIQLLTSRGYAVLQMNFRGSAGYGRAFRMAGERQWGQAMQDDVTDGTHWLIDQGVADPERICIIGGSYGGYTALMGVVKTPKLYQCAVSFNGVSDLKDLMKHNRKFIFGREANSFIAGWGDGAMLDENSPLKRVGEIKVPVLLAHSTKDSIVSFKQSKKMAKALEKAGKDYQFIPLENGNHTMTIGNVRPVFFNALVEFLDEQLH